MGSKDSRGLITRLSRPQRPCSWPGRHSFVWLFKLSCHFAFQKHAWTCRRAQRQGAPHPDTRTLVGFVQTADRTRFWEWRHLQEWHLPYVFLSACDFPPPNGRARIFRPEWLKFQFAGRYRTVEDLWIRASAGYRFLRLVYRAPRNRDPEPTYVIRAESVPVTPTWTNERYRVPNEFAINIMTRAFPEELSR
jgi:hypothetical protein